MRPTRPQRSGHAKSISRTLPARGRSQCPRGLPLARRCPSRWRSWLERQLRDGTGEKIEVRAHSTPWIPWRTSSSSGRTALHWQSAGISSARGHPFSSAALPAEKTTTAMDSRLSSFMKWSGRLPPREAQKSASPPRLTPVSFSYPAEGSEFQEKHCPHIWMWKAIRP